MANTGFIGMGNMAQALFKGLTAYSGIEKDEIYAYAPNREKLLNNAKLLGFNPCFSLTELAKKSDILIMACKPYQIEGVLNEIKHLIAGKMIISVAFGWDFDTYSRYIDTKATHVQYILPNTPVAIGQGVIFMEKKSSLTAEEKDYWTGVFSDIAQVIDLDSSLIPAGSAIAGCGPAFAYLFIEALSDGGVKNGLPRDVAYKAVTQMVIGSAKLMQETGLHPGQLKDQVCSPGGTTIRGVSAMEEGGVRSAMIKAVDAACGK